MKLIGPSLFMCAQWHTFLTKFLHQTSGFLLFTKKADFRIDKYSFGCYSVSVSAKMPA